MSTPLFICGYPRSGTSILGEILDGHPEMTMTNEWGFLRMWEDLLSSIAKPREDGNYEKRAMLSDHIIRTMQIIDSGFKKGFIGSYPQTGKYYGDKMPFYLLIIEWIRKRFPDARFIICSRNRPDTIASMVRQGTDHSEQQIEQVYHKYKRAIRDQKGKEDCLHVDYDELKANTDAGFACIQHWLGVTDLDYSAFISVPSTDEN